MKLTVTQAAKRWKKSKGTIYAKIENGIMSCTIDDTTAKRPRKLIDVSELVRVFGPEDQQEGSGNDFQGTYPQDPISIILTERINDLKAELDYAKEQLAEQKSTYEARIRWLESALQEKEREALEGISSIKDSVGRLLEHDANRPEAVQVLRETAEPEKPEPIAPPEPVAEEPKKRKGILHRMIEAALD